MKKIILLVHSFIVLTSNVTFCHQEDPSRNELYHIENAEKLSKLFPSTALQIAQLTEQYVIDAQKQIDAIISISSLERTFANTLKALDNVDSLSDVAIFTAVAKVLQYTNPDQAIRDAAHEALIKIQAFNVDSLSNNKQLYDAIQYYSENQGKTEQLTQEERYYLELTIEGFRRGGLGLSADTIEKVKKIKKELASLQLDFESNIAKNTKTIHASKEQLAGLTEDFINSLKRTDNELYILGVDYPTFFYVMENCAVEQTRKLLNQAFQNRAYPANEQLLSLVITKRDQLAKLLGYTSFADYDLSNQMVKSVERAEQFIFPLLEKADGKELAEFKELLLDLPAGVELTGDGKLKSWDLAYANNQYKKKHYNLDEQEIAEYFPMEKTILGLFDIYEKFFSIILKEVPASGFWHKEVKLIEIYTQKDNQLVGYLLLDLHPRPNKYTHACHLGVIPATYVGDELVPGLSVVIANFPQSTATQPSLLKLKDVTIFFHEFGHALHSRLGRTFIASLAGTNVKRDFVELPSQMLEEWLTDKEILKKVSCHYKTGQPLPVDIIEKIIEAKNFGSGKFLQGQLFNSLLSLKLFKDGEQKDIALLFKDLYLKSNKSIAFDPENHMYASFGHLMGYGAKYYGYMWSRVFALDLFDTIRTHGLLNPEIGAKYVRDVIGRGASQDPNELLKNFLGREPNQTAFLIAMGLKA